MAELSPAAQAVLDAFRAVPDLRDGPSIAGALRAAVNAVAPEKTIEDIDYVHQSYVDGYKDALYEILILANEFELVSISDTLPGRVKHSGISGQFNPAQ